MLMMLSMLVNLVVELLHTGAGAHASSENDDRGSQPPRQ